MVMLNSVTMKNKIMSSSTKAQGTFHKQEWKELEDGKACHETLPSRYDVAAAVMNTQHKTEPFNIPARTEEVP